MADWTTQAADAIETAVTTVRDRTVVPARKATKVVVYGLLVAFFALTAVFLLVIGLFRLLVIVTGEVWAAYVILGGIFVIGGTFCWATARRAPRRELHDRNARRRARARHRRLRTVRPDRRRLRGAGQPAPGGDRRSGRRRPAHADHRRRELPGLPRRDPRPRAHDEVPRAGGALRRGVRDRRRRPRRSVRFAVRRLGRRPGVPLARR